MGYQGAGRVNADVAESYKDEMAGGGSV